MELTLVIPFLNGYSTLGRLLEGLPRDIPVIIVDDLSDIPLERPNFNNCTVIRLKEKGYFSGAVNAGLEACQGDALVLNQDATLDGTAWLDWLAERREKYAAMGEGVLNHPAWPRGYIQGTWMFIQRAAWDKVGIFNARDYPLWGATCEWQLRACRMGYKVLPVPQSEIPGFRHAAGRKAHTGDSIATALQREPDKQGLFIRTPPAVSVIIPCYEYAHYLPDAVHSLIGGKTFLGDFPAQTFASFEVIIVNDGSPDNTREVAQSLADDWQGVRYIERPNGGTAAANNTGVSVAHGKYITILSADDMRESFALESLYRYSEANPGRAVCDDMVVFGQGKRLQVARMTDDFSLDFLLADNPMHAGLMYPREAWRKLGGYPENFADGREDWAFNLKLASAGICALQTHQAGYLYRREGQNRTLGNYSKKAWFIDKLRATFPELYKGVKPMGCCGHGSRQPSASVPANLPLVMTKLAGADGMVMLEYLGASSGSVTFKGSVSRAKYVFNNGGKRRAWVDGRDVEDLLRKMEYKSNLFRIVPPDPSYTPAAPAEQVVGEVKAITPPAPFSEPETPAQTDSLAPVAVFEDLPDEPIPEVADELPIISAKEPETVSESKPEEKQFAKKGGRRHA